MATFAWPDRERAILKAVNDGYERGELVENAAALADTLSLPLYEANYLAGARRRSRWLGRPHQL